MTKQQHRTGLTLLAFAIAGGTAFAGFKRTNMDFVKMGYEAEGDLGAVRANTAVRDDIGCQTQVTPGQESTGVTRFSYYGYCWATDSNGKKMMCWSNWPEMVQQMATLNGDSYLRFFPSGNTGGSECGSVVTSAASDYRSKSP